MFREKPIDFDGETVFIDGAWRDVCVAIDKSNEDLSNYTRLSLDASEWSKSDLSELVTLCAGYNYVSVDEIKNPNYFETFSGFKNLKSLRTNTYTKVSLEVLHQAIPNLLELDIAADRKSVKDIENLFMFSGLITLSIGGLRSDDLMLVSPHSSLEHLYLTGGKVLDSYGIQHLEKLRTLRARCYMETFSSPLGKLKHLEVVDLSSNPKLQDLSNLKGLHASVLDLREIKKLSDLEFLRNNEHIEQLTLHAKIYSGNFQPLLEMPSLKKCTLLGQRYYTKALKELGALDDQRFNVI